MIHDYSSSDDMGEVELAAAKKMDDIIIHHQTDYLKLTKSFTFYRRGHILLVRG